VLAVELDPEVSSAGFASLAKLPKLRRLFFGDCDQDETLRLHLRCLPLCAQHMPKLQQMGDEFSGLYYASILDDDNADKFYHNEILQQPCQLSIEKLVISGDVMVHEGCQLPQLNELHLFCPTSSVVGHFTNGRFSAVSHVGFYTSAVDTTMDVLQIVGWRLRSLVIEESPSHLSLLSVLESCPNLEKITLDSCPLSQTEVMWSERLFRCLDELKIVAFGFRPFPPGLLVKV
jgi:hypothetical protein